ncbi:ERF family protein [Porphyromonas vaginalis]|jgi:hypothetical protein|uniref:ERF family protein n=1 Tax=Porphyromonas vaginalis TaxID=3044325 RepID=UPI002626AD6F|nr:ERF family protein [Porphyromonas vaginalis]
MQELQIIQARLKAPKGQYNSFGGFKYRSLEDIFEALKPLLAETHTSLVVGDEIVLIGERYYVCATATLTNQRGEQVTNRAYAREDLVRGKMDGSQMTGSASSYARKYALNGLFAIDDTKDADTDEYTKATKEGANSKQATAKSQQPKANGQQPAEPALTAEMRQKLEGSKTVTELYKAFGELPQGLREHPQVKAYCSELRDKLEGAKLDECNK